MEDKKEEIYAGFWVRVSASFIDGLILMLPLWIVEQVFGEGSATETILFLFIWCIYSIKMLSSSWRATIGKKLLGIEVTNLQGEGLSFKEALIRTLLSIVSYGLLLPILMMLFTDKGQTFHDYYGKTIVLDNVMMFSEKKHTFENVMRVLVTLIVLVFIAIQLYVIGLFGLLLVMSSH